MHGWILRYLYEHQDKEIYQKDIEKYFGICRSAVTNIIQTLEKKGYICRASVANDARLKKVMLTEKGRENHEKLGEIFQKMDAQLEEGITEEELLGMPKGATLVTLCRRLHLIKGEYR